MVQCHETISKILSHLPPNPHCTERGKCEAQIWSFGGEMILDLNNDTNTDRVSTPVNTPVRGIIFL